jgi:hypothetical protein
MTNVLSLAAQEVSHGHRIGNCNRSPTLQAVVAAFTAAVYGPASGSSSQTLTNGIDESFDILDVGVAEASTLAATLAVDPEELIVRRDIVTERDSWLAIDVCRICEYH